jgi:hypothetical protein
MMKGVVVGRIDWLRPSNAPAMIKIKVVPMIFLDESLRFFLTPTHIRRNPPIKQIP